MATKPAKVVEKVVKPREGNRLSPLTVERLTKPGMHCDGFGLWLQVSVPPGGDPRRPRRSWIFRFTSYVGKNGEPLPRGKGRQREMGLGRAGSGAGEIPLAGKWVLDKDGDGTKKKYISGARDLAEECRTLVRQGIDPIEGRNAKREQVAREMSQAKKVAPTFEWCMDKKLATVTKWSSEKYREQWRAGLVKWCKPIMAIPVDAISVGSVLEVLTQASNADGVSHFWQDRPSLARAVRQRVEKILDWAIAEGHREGPNPARYEGRIVVNLEGVHRPKKKNFAAVPYRELPVLMAKLREDKTVPAVALRFTILTASRPSEALGAQWSEVDLKKRLWTVPASRMKMKKEHEVPLCDQAVELLEKLDRRADCPLLFPSSTDTVMFPNRMREVLVQLVPGKTVHGTARSSFRVWALESGVTQELAELCLAHEVGTEVERSYKHSTAIEARRPVMARWAEHLHRPPAKPAKVVPIAKGRRKAAA